MHFCAILLCVNDREIEEVWGKVARERKIKVWREEISAKGRKREEEE